MSVEDRAANVLELTMGQDVVDSEGKKIGKLRANFERYILVERGGLFVKAYYVPHSFIVTGKKVVHLSVTEEELREQGYNTVPDDLFPETPEPEVPRLDGTPQFGLRPLSPAQTGHYNYGRRWPGINTDASGSYHREEVVPNTQLFVEEADDTPGR